MFFDNMTPTEAKIEYHKLISQYHPDKFSGDKSVIKYYSDITSVINKEYDKFKLETTRSKTI